MILQPLSNIPEGYLHSVDVSHWETLHDYMISCRYGGMCAGILGMGIKGVISPEIQSNMMLVLKCICSLDSHWFEPGDMQPRIDWLDKLIKECYG